MYKPIGRATFFISDKNKLYACGYNIKESLGSIKYEEQSTCTPTLIHLQNVIDAKSNKNYHII